MFQKLKDLWKRVRTITLAILWAASTQSILFATLLAKNISNDYKLLMFAAEMIAMVSAVLLDYALNHRQLKMALLGPIVMFGVMVTTLTATQRAFPMETLITWLQMFGVLFLLFSLLSIPDLLKKTETKAGTK